MEITPAPIAAVRFVVPKVVRDERGFFCETYNLDALAAAGIAARFVQDNHSLSVEAGVVRGLHFQIPPYAQDKLVRVVRGAIFDVAVDIRHDSPTFGQHVSAVLSAENWRQMWVPRGFAHGFCTLEPNTEVIYKVTNGYAPEFDRGLLWNDPGLRIAWPGVATNAILSARDRSHPPLAMLPQHFIYEGPP